MTPTTHSPEHAINITTEGAVSLRDRFCAWVISALVNITDAFGSYTSTGVKTRKASITTQVLERHFDGTGIIGIHAGARDNTSKWVGLDFDNHAECPEQAERNRESARVVYDRLRESGAEPLLEDSDGQGGFHIWVIFDRPVLSAAAFAWIRAMAPEAHEHYPKQPGIGSGKFGNWLRLPGRHPRRDHWSKFWDPKARAWVAWPECVELLVDSPRCPASIVPECAATDREAGRPAVGKQNSAPGVSSRPEGTIGDYGQTPRELLRAIALLLRLAPGRAEGYDTWLRVGMAVHSVDSSPLGLAVWDAWSRQCREKWQSGVCAEKWGTFGGRDSGVTMGSLVHWAREDSAGADVTTEQRLAALNVILFSDETGVRIQRMLRRGKVKGNVEIEFDDGTVVGIENVSKLANFGTVRDALMEGAGVVLPKKELAKDWDAIAAQMLACVEQVEGESDEDELVELLDTCMSNPPPLNADDEEERERLVTDPHIVFFRRGGCLHLRLGALFARVKMKGLWRHDRRELANRLARLGWARFRGSVGSREKRVRGTIFVAPDGVGDEIG